MNKGIRSFLLLLTILSFTSCLQSAKAQAYTDDQGLLSDNNSGMITLKSVLKTIEQKYDVTFLYKTELVSDKYVPETKALSTDLFQLLYSTLKDNNLRLKQMGKTLYVILPVESSLKRTTTEIKQFSVNGKVTDAKTGEALPGVNIMLKGTESANIIGTTTDGNGNYTLDVPDSHGTLLFSYIGYKTASVNINGRKVINVALRDTTIGGKEVVVTALGIKRHERSLGYSVQSVQGSNLQKVQGVDIETSLTGKVAGLLVENGTGFTDEPTIKLRGETPLLVIDGVPYTNMTLRDVPADNIKNISVLKGATASALYGDRGASGAIMVTTKHGSGATKGLTVSYNGNTMFNAGFLAIPKVQSTFGRKVNSATNTYARTADGSWGVPMDGRQVVQWDPISKSLKSMAYLPIGKNNFQNYLEPGYIMNNNLSMSENGDLGSLRASASWLRNKGQYPNSMFNKITYNLAGEMQKNQFSLSSSLSFTHQNTPNMGFRGYTAYNPMYSMLIWGSQDYDVRKYKDYWLVPNESQNDSYTSAANNPYFNAYQRTHGESRDIFNGSLALKYDIMPWLKATYRVGFDTYNDKQQITISEGSLVSGGSSKVLLNGSQVWGQSKKGSYNMGIGRGYSINNDLLLSGDKTFNDFKVSGFVGGTIYYKQDEGMEAFTRGGLSIPGFYSLSSSINPIKVDSRIYKQQVNSLYGQLALSWRDLVYADGTLRNDWSSTMPASNSSYMYPSASLSFVASQLLPKMDWLSFWKLRASWASSKTPPSIYEVNSVYNVTNNAWGNLNSASYPTTIRGNNVLPQSSSTFELGTAFDLFQNRASVDVAVYKKRMYDFLVATGVDPASGFYNNYVNTQEETARKGIEITAKVTPIRTSDWNWDVSLNWSKYAEYYTKLDSVYSPDNPWIKVGARTDALVLHDFLRDPQGNIIFSNGLPQYSKYLSKYGNSNPDWIWGASTTLTHKSWTFSMSVDGRVGGLIPSTTAMYMWISGAMPASATHARYLDATNPGTANYVGKGVKVVSGTVTYDTYGNITSDTRTYAPNDVAVTYERYVKAMHKGTAWGGSPSPADVYNATFFKIREISITYALPKSLYEKLNIRGASISAIGQNVFLWAKQFKYSDPDGGHENFSAPSQRYLGMSLKLDF